MGRRRLRQGWPHTLFEGGFTCEGETERRRANAAAKTYPGMAHFGGTGPREYTCRQCSFFSIEAGQAYKVADKLLKDARCAKAQVLMNITDTPKIPPTARSCKYFQLNPAAPPLYGL